jgi:predicted O-linked N-acetylglucosamine transferase (SPINDLY family)
MLLSNRRMAPLQVMTLGHPATSMSREIDAVVTTTDIIGNPDCFSEALVAMPPEAVRFQLPADLEHVAPLRELPESGVIRIAVPSVAQKLTAAFVRCLREVQERATRPVEFVFFSGEFGVFHAAASHNLLRELNHVTIHGTLPYRTYIREINRCQLHACTFPFGGTNSLLDSLRQGLPLVTLEGKEAHARIDAAFIRKVKLPESLICHDEQAYVECLLHLVEHPDELQRLRLYLLDEVDVDKTFLQDGDPALFADLMYRLYKSGRDGLKVVGGDVIKPLP